jgi:hypothetical protein
MMPMAAIKSRIKKIGWARPFVRRASALKQWLSGWIAIARMLMHPPRKLNGSAGVLVSLTTYSKRLDKFGWVLDSLLRQNCETAYSVSVFLSRQDLPNGELPAKLKKYQTHGIRFVLVDENLKSYKKLVYAYKEESNTIIVTADDDIIYPSYWLRELIRRHRQEPECIIAYRAHYLLLDRDLNILPYRQLMELELSDVQRLTPSFNLMPTGVSGVLYPPHSLDPVALDAALFTHFAPNADDVWFKLASLLKHRRCVQVEGRNRHFPFVPGSQADALTIDNVVNYANDVQIEASFGLFQEARKLLALQPSPA